MSTIFITEKPSVAQEYRKTLKVESKGKTDGYIEGYSPVVDDNVIITWAVGHLIAICSPEEHNEDWGGRWSKAKLPMIPDEFKYKPQSATAKQFKIVSSLYKRKDITRIYYAGDSGREGIYIQALIRNQIFKSKPRIDERVVWISSYTEQAILDGIKTAKPYEEYQNMIDSGYARAISDWLIGMNFTEGFTVTSHKLVNCGRVMTPTLAMIVNRQNEIDNFVKTDYYGIKGGDAKWKAVEGTRYFESNLLYDETGFLKKEDAEALVGELSQDERLTVDKVNKSEKTEYAPYLFNLPDFQAFCSRTLHISTAQALEIAQSLYEKKFTTYPRTDCRFLSSAVAIELKSKGYDVPKRYINDAKVEDHYAIIPTFYGDPDTLSGNERKAYDAIYGRFMDTMKPPFKYDSVSVVYLHSNGERFFESFRVVKQLGYKEGKKLDKDNDNKDNDEAFAERTVPQKGDIIDAQFEVQDKETKPPLPYKEGDLPLAMEKAGKLIEDEELREQIKTSGIGTVATRSGIIEKLKEKQFIAVDKKQKVSPTEFGKQVIPIIAKFDEALISPVKTADMEGKLDAIVKGNLSKDEYLKEVEQYVRETTKRILSENSSDLSAFDGSKKRGSVIGKCPKCGQDIKEGQYGFYCVGKCGMNVAKVYGKVLTEAQVTKLLSGKEISYTANGRKTIVLPEVAASEYQGKTYYNWATKSGGNTSSGSKSKSSSGWGNKSSNSKSSNKGGWGKSSSNSSAKSGSKLPNGITWGKKK